MKTYIHLLMVLFLFGCNSSNDDNETKVISLSDELETCEFNNGNLSCSGHLTVLNSFSALDGVTSIQFNDVILSQAALESMPVLDAVEDFTFNANGGGFTSFDSTKFPALQTLTITNSKTLTSINNLDSVPQLKVLNISNNPNLTTVDVAALTQLTHFNATNNKKLILDLSTLPATESLLALDISDSGIKISSSGSVSILNTPNKAELVTRFTKLTELSISGTNFNNGDKLDMSEITNQLGDQLTRLEILEYDNNFDLNLSSFSQLKILNVDQSGNVNLIISDKWPENIEYLDFSYINNCDLRSLIDAKLTNLAVLKINNQIYKNIGYNDSVQINALLSELVTTYGQKLVELDVAQNNITEISLEELPSIRSLNVSNNSNISFDLSQLPNEIQILNILETGRQDISSLKEVSELMELKLGDIVEGTDINATLSGSRLTLEVLEFTQTGVAGAGITELTLTDFPVLREIRSLANMELATITLKDLPALVLLNSVYNPKLNSIEITNSPMLGTLTAHWHDKLANITLDEDTHATIDHAGLLAFDIDNLKSLYPKAIFRDSN